jgi:hypothetical protein
MDKAAIMAYCRIQNKADRWVGCECCFTIVYDIMVVCTSIYHRDGKSDGKFSLDARRPKACSCTAALPHPYPLRFSLQPIKIYMDGLGDNSIGMVEAEAS